VGWEKENKKISWFKWENACKQKEEGGLGVKDLKLFDMTLLTKWK